jgi:ferric-dicitrate binding protein FerR (iron transport regulator)
MKMDKARRVLKEVLEGTIRPGSEAWERLWSDDDARFIRETLLELGVLRPGELLVRHDEIWRRVEHARAERERRSRRLWTRRVAAVLLPLVVAGAWWWSGERWASSGDPVVLAQEVPAVTNNRAVLVLGDGERVDLSSVVADTAWQRAGVTLSLDTGKVLSYRAGEQQRREPEYNTMIVPRTGEYQLVLDDGTRVFLNSESELRFPVAFVGDERRVYLQGEGYFEVTRADDRPFIVTAGGVDLHVLGTAFNVDTRGPGDGILATLVSGSLRVSVPGDVEPIVLQPGQQAGATAGGITVQDVDVSLYTSWVHGRFTFEGATLDRIAGQLERWYDVRFVFTDEVLGEMLFTGMFKREQPIERAISIIARTTRVKFDKRGDTVTVSR